MDELYTLYSCTDPSHYPDAQVGEDHCVELEWFCVDRPHPVAAYATLIHDYAVLEEPYRSDAQRYIDELFTRDEIRLLLPYLLSVYGQRAATRVIPIPLDIWVAAGDSMATPMTALLAHGTWCIVHTLSPKEPGYPLPFTVSACYRRAF